MSAVGLLVGVSLAAELVVGVDAPTVQETVDLATKGDTVVLPDGVWAGPVVVRRPITLVSAAGVLEGDVGTTLRIESPGVVLDHLIVRGSGDDLQGPDACVYVATEASGTVIRDSSFSDCLFGIWLHHVRGARVVHNLVRGRPDASASAKGNGIHLYDSEELEVRGNTVTGARDGIYVSATEHSVIADNKVSNQRFGIHYMYSNDNVVEGNQANDNSGGIALMQSRDLVIRNNEASRNQRHGILFRDAQGCEIVGNRVVDNVEGLFFFSSLDNRIVGNLVAGNQIGARVWAGTERNVVEGNSFVGNAQQIFYVAASDQHWGSNYWSDYLGWDQDGDGRGDRPYRNDAFMATLLHRYPAAVLLMNSPSLELLSQLQTRLPALRVPTVIDDAPSMIPPGEL